MNTDTQKQFLLNRILAECKGFGLDVNTENSDTNKPWGAYLRFSGQSKQQFLKTYWSDISLDPNLHESNFEPKILLVSPGSQLSLQYHARRQEKWRVLAGPAKIILGPDGTSLREAIYNTGDVIEIPQGYWHRLAGTNNWAIIAEIWEHTVPGNPSNEEDIVRVNDDYSRS